MFQPKEAAAPAAAAPAAVTQSNGIPAAGAIGAPRSFVTGSAAPIGSKTHLDAAQPTAAADTDIIAAGGHSSHPFGSAIHDDSLSTGADASYDNSQYSTFHQNDLLSNQSTSTYDAQVSHFIRHSSLFASRWTAYRDSQLDDENIPLCSSGYGRQINRCSKH